MIDLHTHTNYSDGTWSVRKLLEEAEKIKLEILSITDHDNVKANLEIRDKQYYKLFSGKIIPGVELNVIAYGVKVEILAYDFDLDKVSAWCDKSDGKEFTDDELIEQCDQIIETAKNNGIILGDIHYTPSYGWPIKYIYHEIKKNIDNKKFFTDREWIDINYFLRSATCDTEFPVYMDLSRVLPSINATIKVIHSAGGKVFLAHLYKYPIRDHDKFLNQLVDNKLIDGVEVYHSSFTQEQIDYLYDYCLKHKLLMSGGSDCHGDKKYTRKLGIGYGNLNIDRKIVTDWIK